MNALALIPAFVLGWSLRGVWTIWRERHKHSWSKWVWGRHPSGRAAFYRDCAACLRREWDPGRGWYDG